MEVVQINWEKKKELVESKKSSLAKQTADLINGYDATKAIRRSSHEAAKKIPIIAMSANAFSEDVQHSLAAGMNAHISKPVEMKVLEKTIRSIKSGGGGYRTAGHCTVTNGKEPAQPTTKICPFCMSEIDIRATRCPHCTSVQPESEADQK